MRDTSPITRLFLLMLLAGLLCVPAAMKKPAASAGRYGFHYTDATEASGIHFIHEAPHLDSKLDPIMPQTASMGAAVSVVDFDRDGWPDLYVVNSGEGSKNHLYRNMHDGTFKD